MWIPRSSKRLRRSAGTVSRRTSVKTWTTCFPAIVCTHLLSISPKADLTTAQQVEYVVAQLPVAPKVYLFLVNVCALLERKFSLQCRRTLRRRSPHHSIEGPCFSPRFLWVCLLCKAFKRDKFPKTRAAAKNPGRQLHFITCSISLLPVVLADKAAKGAKWWSIGPAFVEFRVSTQTSKTWKFPTHQRIAKAVFFSFDAPSSRALKHKRAPLHYFRRRCHHLKVALPWHSRRLCGFQRETNKIITVAKWRDQKVMFVKNGILYMVRNASFLGWLH